MARQSRQGTSVRLTSPDKMMFPEVGFTKRDLADYYDAVADALLPQLHDRPVTRVRFPDGVTGERVFQRNAPAWTPAWMRTFRLSASPGGMKRSPGPARRVVYPVIDDRSGLRWMANQASVELHTPQWRLGPRGGVRRPDRLVVDLDPGAGVGLAECAEVAHSARSALEELGLTVLPVTSGGKGLHLYADVTGPDLPFPRTARSVHAQARLLAQSLESTLPGLVVAHASKEDRRGRVFVDWSQNHPARSTVCPYSLRAKGAAPTVAAPRTWEEIRPGLAQLSPGQVLARLAREGDLAARTGANRR